ncbi:MAG: Ig-like domain-containing protein, partial [Cyanobacteria bacterium J06639_14]
SSRSQATAVTLDLLSNDTDVDEGDTLSITAVGTASNGAVENNNDGTVTYTPNAGFNGTDSFTYVVSDDNGATDTATVTVNVLGITPNPELRDDGFGTDEDSELTANVLANDTLPPGEFLLGVATDVENGSLTLNADGSFIYIPDANFNGTDSFVYEVSNGEFMDEATVSLLIESVNDDPVALDDRGNTAENTPVTLNVLENDSDVDGDTLSISTVGSGANGSVIDNGDGTVTYTPDAGFSGIDSFTYTINDGSNGTATATVEVNVIGNANLPPDAVEDEFDLDEDAVLDGNVLLNDSDPNGDELTANLLTDVSNGSLSLNADGSFSYIPNPDFNGSDSFTYVVTDGRFTDTAVVSLAIAPVNDDPVAVDDSGSTTKNKPVTLNVLDNDSDVDGDNLTITAVVATGNGNAVANDDGTITYTPNPNFTGSDTFVYEISDGNGGTATAAVNVTVNPIGTGADLDIGIYDANSDKLITLLQEGDEILASKLLGKKVTLAAFVPDDSPFADVESMFLDLNDGQFTRTENFEPYALFGDIKGDFIGQTNVFPEGKNSIVFDLYDRDRLKGDLLGTVTRNFTIVDDISGSAELTVGLFDAESDTLITEIDNGDEILASTLADRSVTIAAFVPDDSVLKGQVESMFFNLNEGEITRVENFEPYALFGDIKGDYKGGTLPLGDSTIAFDLYSRNRLKGEFLGTVTRDFTIIDDQG